MKRKIFRDARLFSRMALMVCLAATAAMVPAVANERPRLLVFNTAFFDMMTSGTGESFTTPEDYARVKQFSEALRESIAGGGSYRIVSRPDGAGNDEPADLSCSACILDTARAAGADFIVTSAVTRFNSSLVYVKAELDDVATQKAVKVSNEQVNGFNDPQLKDAATRAADYLLKAKPAERWDRGKDAAKPQ